MPGTCSRKDNTWRKSSQKWQQMTINSAFSHAHRPIRCQALNFFCSPRQLVLQSWTENLKPFSMCTGHTYRSYREHCALVVFSIEGATLSSRPNQAPRVERLLLWDWLQAQILSSFRQALLKECSSWLVSAIWGSRWMSYSWGSDQRNGRFGGARSRGVSHSCTW